MPRRITLLLPSLVQQVVEYLHRHHLLSPSDRIGVAVSGGADSVVLLEVLHRLRSHFACELLVLHVNHHLRAAESDADELFVRSLAQEHGLPFAVEQAAAPDGNIEQKTRDMRRAFFKRAMTEHGLRRVALGHTRSDQAETVLFRLLRGTGLSGLAGMRPVTADGLIRPLLAISREEIRAWAETEHIVWREDSSNQDRSFTRNRLRLDTLPALTATYNPNLERILAHAAELAKGEEDYWNQHIELLFQQHAKQTSRGWSFAVDQLAALDPAVQRRLVRRAVREVRGDLRSIDFEHVEAIVNLCRSTHGHDRVIIPGVDALRSFDELQLAVPGRLNEPRDYRVALNLGQECELPFGSGRIYVNWLEPAFDFCANFKEEQEKLEVFDLNGDLLAQEGTLPSLYARNWLPGDGLERPGHETGEKIKTLFQMEKVRLWERRHWPVVIAGKEIVWTRQFGGAAKYSELSGTRKVVRLVYRHP